jgi:hypothetical protein
MIEETLNALRAAITENTAVLREVLAASGAPANVVPMPEAPKPAKKQKVEKPPVVESEPPVVESEPSVVEPEPVAVVEPEPVAVVEPEPVAVVEPEPPVVEPEPPVVESEPVTEEPTTFNPEALITQVTEAWKAQLTAADPERKVMLKDKFPELRAKWGLAPDDKLITLTPTPEKLAGLLADIKEL